MKLFRAMATVAGLTGVSRILGFIRDVLTAAILGAGPIADAFFVALKLPNFFRRVTAEGAFTVSFVPLYTESLEKEGRKDADIFASRAFSMMLVIMVPFTLLALFAMPFVIYGIAPGFGQGTERYDLAVDLSRVTFPYLLLMSLSALIGAVLNAHNRFAPFAAAPVIFNLCLITALLTAHLFETAGHAMAYGVLIAGIIQLLWLFYCLKRARGRITLMRPVFSPKIKKLFALMGPGVIGAGVMHINLFADLIIASLLWEGSISYLYYADRLNQLPLGMVGIAVGTALLPMLSKAVAASDAAEATHLFNRALELCLLFALPAALALMAIPEILIGTLFERGAFTADDTAVTALVLTGYAIGMPAYIAVKVFSTVYWSQQNTLSPVKISVITTLLNIALSLILIWPFGVAGIAVSTGIMGWLQLALLYRGVQKQQSKLFDTGFLRTGWRIALSAVIMAVTVKAVSMMMVFDHKIMTLSLLVMVGLIVYAGLIFGTKAITLSAVKRYFKKG